MFDYLWFQKNYLIIINDKFNVIKPQPLLHITVILHHTFPTNLRRYYSNTHAVYVHSVRHTSFNSVAFSVITTQKNVKLDNQLGNNTSNK